MTKILQAVEPFNQLPDHARQAVAHHQQRAASEARIERIAEQVIDRHGLADRRWDHADERHDVLAVLESEAAREHCLDDCQGIYLADLLDEWSNR